MKDAGATKDDIKEVLLVGGSSRIPKVRELIKKYFNGHEPLRSINPDQAIAEGAAIEAAIHSGVHNGHLDQLLLMDSQPHTLGIKIDEDTMVSIVHRNTAIPIKK